MEMMILILNFVLICNVYASIDIMLLQGPISIRHLCTEESGNLGAGLCVDALEGLDLLAVLVDDNSWGILDGDAEASAGTLLR
jgi:hypothetical protein